MRLAGGDVGGQLGPECVRLVRRVCVPQVEPDGPVRVRAARQAGDLAQGACLERVDGVVVAGVPWSGQWGGHVMNTARAFARRARVCAALSARDWPGPGRGGENSPRARTQFLGHVVRSAPHRADPRATAGTVTSLSRWVTSPSHANPSFIIFGTNAGRRARPRRSRSAGGGVGATAFASQLTKSGTTIGNTAVAGAGASGNGVGPAGVAGVGGSGSPDAATGPSYSMRHLSLGGGVGPIE